MVCLHGNIFFPAFFPLTEWVVVLYTTISEAAVSVVLFSGGQARLLHFKSLGLIDRYELQMVGHPFLLIHTVGREGEEKGKQCWDGIAVFSKIQDSRQKLRNYLSIRMPID